MSERFDGEGRGAFGHEKTVETYVKTVLDESAELFDGGHLEIVPLREETLQGLYATRAINNDPRIVELIHKIEQKYGKFEPKKEEGK